MDRAPFRFENCRPCHRCVSSYRSDLVLTLQDFALDLPDNAGDRLRDCLETLLWRPSDGVFCAHGPKCPLRSGSRNHHHMTRQSEFRNSLLDHRMATRADMPALTVLMNAAIGELQKPFLRQEQIDSSRAIMGWIRSSSTMEPILSWSRMASWSAAADGVGGQPSTEATVHPGAMPRCSTPRTTPRACVPCIRSQASPAEG